MNHSIDNKLVFTSEQPRMTQLLATLVPAMFEAWNKVTLSSDFLAQKHMYHYISSFTFHSQAEVSYVHRKVNQLRIHSS